MFQVQKYMIADHFVCALEYGDLSGMSGDEEAQIDQFVGSLPGTGHWSWGEQSEFAKCEVCGLHANCLEAEWVYKKD